MTKEEMRLQLLQLAVQHAGPKNAVRVAAEYEAYVKDGTHYEPNDSADAKAEEPKLAETKPVEQPAPVPQPAVPAGKTATFEDCAKSFQAHVQRGQGRSAMTARAAIIKAIPHYTSFKALSPEECATAIDVMDAA